MKMIIKLFLVLGALTSFATLIILIAMANQFVRNQEEAEDSDVPKKQDSGLVDVENSVYPLD
jgi:hypothetical protein